MHYKAYNLTITSKLDLPFRKLDTANDCSAEKVNTQRLQIAEYKLKTFPSVSLINRKYDGLLRSYDVKSGILLCASNSYRIEVERNGANILIDADKAALQHAILSATALCFSVCLICRGILVLHAAVVQVNSAVIGIIAESGTGKSTLLWKLLDQGAHLISDDALAIDIQDNRVKSLPSLLPPKLWEDSLDTFDVDVSRRRKISPESAKYWVELPPRQIVSCAKSLDALFILEPTNVLAEKDEVLITKKHGMEILKNLVKYTHGVWMIPNDVTNSLISTYTFVAKTIPLYALSYKRSYTTLTRLSDIIWRFASELDMNV